MDGINLPLTREQLTALAAGQMVAIDVPDADAPESNTVARVFLRGPAPTPEDLGAYVSMLANAADDQPAEMEYTEYINYRVVGPWGDDSARGEADARSKVARYRAEEPGPALDIQADHQRQRTYEGWDEAWVGNWVEIDEPLPPGPVFMSPDAVKRIQRETLIATADAWIFDNEWTDEKRSKMPIGDFADKHYSPGDNLTELWLRHRAEERYS
jgi:hypothetical protein